MATRYFNRRSFLQATASSGLLVLGLKEGALFDDSSAIHSFRLDHLAGFICDDYHFALKWYYEIFRTWGNDDLRSVLQLKILDDFDKSRIGFKGPYLVSDTEVNIFKIQEALNGLESDKKRSSARV